MAEKQVSAVELDNLREEIAELEKQIGPLQEQLADKQNELQEKAARFYNQCGLDALAAKKKAKAGGARFEPLGWALEEVGEDGIGRGELESRLPRGQKKARLAKVLKKKLFQESSGHVSLTNAGMAKLAKIAESRRESRE